MRLGNSRPRDDAADELTCSSSGSYGAADAVQSCSSAANEDSSSSAPQQQGGSAVGGRRAAWLTTAIATVALTAAVVLSDRARGWSSGAGGSPSRRSGLAAASPSGGDDGGDGGGGGDRSVVGRGGGGARQLDFLAHNDYTEGGGTPLGGGLYPWKVIVEPHRPTKLHALVDGEHASELDEFSSSSPASASSSSSFAWRIVHADDAAASAAADAAGGDAAAAATTALAVVEGEGAVFEHTFTCVGSHAVSLSLSRSPSSPPQFAPAAVFTGEAMCKYVRRELRSLSKPDRERFFDALEVLYKVGYEAGTRKYGAGFKEITWLVREHLEGAASHECDHWHDGAGIMTHHAGFTLELEQALQVRERLRNSSCHLVVPSRERGSGTRVGCPRLSRSRAGRVTRAPAPPAPPGDATTMHRTAAGCSTMRAFRDLVAAPPPAACRRGRIRAVLGLHYRR